MARYNEISHQLLSELLVAIATGGEVIGGNNRGSDVRSPTHGLIEVKSRLLGTDGPWPRVSLRRHNVDKADWIAAVRWNPDFTFFDAVMLPKQQAAALFAARKQVSRDAAHITWQDWTADPEASSIKEACRKALAHLAGSAHSASAPHGG